MDYQKYFIYSAFILVFGIISLLFSKAIIDAVVNIATGIEKQLQAVPMPEIIKGSIGLIIGLFIAFLLSSPIAKAVPSGALVAIMVMLYLLLGYLGVNVVTKRWSEINWNTFIKRSKDQEKADKAHQWGEKIPKILDTSVIIDGRIFDICKTGFVEGPIIIPGFVLEELRHIADSADDLKRNRGRRGLDILKMIQQELDIEVVVSETDFEDVNEVDVKLLKLGQLLNGRVVTNDYNLNKVADVQGVAVLNINELANAIKPVVLPGEKMKIQIIKLGKENGQGVAYLDDGTMIVVEEGKNYIGKTIIVTVTSVLQTAAGRMIFAKPKLAAKGA
jgi:uncharacterized protein YacL